MKRQERDPLELVLPELDAAAREHAARVLRGLGLLGSASRGGHSPSALTDLGRARDEVDRLREEELGACFEDLLRHLLPELQHADACLWPGAPRRGWKEAWLTLAQDPDLDLDLPHAGEGAEALLKRVLARATRERLAAQAPVAAGLALWRARADHVLGRVDRARERWDQLAERDDGVGRAARVDLAAATLERGDVRAALERLAILAPPQDDVRARTAPDASGTPPGEEPCAVLASHLRTWCSLLEGPGPTPEIASGACAVPPIPANLVQLLESRGASGSGAAPAMRRAGSGARPPRVLRDRRDLGCSVLAVLRLDPPDVLAVHLDLAPALRARRDTWLRDRGDRWRDPGDPVREALARGMPQVLHGQRLPGALDPEARALALVPLLDARGGPVGWLQLEHRQGWVPSVERLGAMARVWSEDCFVAPGDDPAPDRVGEATGAVPRLRRESRPVDPALESVFRAAVGGVGLGRRRWTGIVLEPAGPRRVVEDGEELGESDGGARALDRARLLAGPVRWEEPDADLALHGRAGCGVVVPWDVEGLPVGHLVLEGARRRDLPERDVRAWCEGAEEHALALLAARLEAEHLERYGRRAVLPVRVPAVAQRLRALVRAVRSRAPVVLVGPPGAGKGQLARLLLPLLGPVPEVRLGPGLHGLGRHPGATWVLEGPERLPATDQRRLVEHLAVHGGDRLLITLDQDPAGSFDRGDLDPELAEWLVRGTVQVPALARRRAELPAWIEGLLHAQALDDRRRPPTLEPLALAALWRLDWSEGLGCLDRVLQHLVRDAEDRSLGEAAVLRTLASLGLEPRSRFPSRRPPHELLRDALEASRVPGGKANHTAAARLLGWDRGTLLVRLREAGLEG